MAAGMQIWLLGVAVCLGQIFCHPTHLKRTTLIYSDSVFHQFPTENSSRVERNIQEHVVLSDARDGHFPDHQNAPISVVPLSKTNEIYEAIPSEQDLGILDYVDSNLSVQNEEVTNSNFDMEEMNEHHGIHVASWRWDEIGVFFTFTVFIVVTGLAKVAFHHAHFISAHIPESCLMIIVGVSVGGIMYMCGVASPNSVKDNIVVKHDNSEHFIFPTFTPRLFFLILLPPVVLESSYSLYNRAFGYNAQTILMFAVVGTVFNTFTIGPLLYLLSTFGLMGGIHLQPGDTESYYVGMTECLVFSALISAVDPVAVLAIFQEIGVNEDLYYLVFGESLLNDAVTVVLYTTMVTFCNMPSISGVQYGLALIAFFTVSCGGVAVGLVFGLLTALITKTTQECRVVEPLAILGVAYLSYLTAELFHFSGIISIIMCGLVQAHYALKNISQKSYTTVKYFTKMLSSTSDAIIFLFLGMVLVNDRHVWHTGFALWTLALCFVARFLGVFLLTGLANKFRVKKINLQEQFIMAYGGLRGAVAFSMVEMLDEDTIKPHKVFVTTTLIVILFTVFIQGSTVKPLVKLLNIAKSGNETKTIVMQISENVMNTMMAGIEEISGVRGDFYIRRKFEQIDNLYLKRLFLIEGSENELTKLYEKLTLTEHFAHLYGPVTLVEEKKALLLHDENAAAAVLPDELTSPRLRRTSSARRTYRISSLFPGVEIRQRANSVESRESAQMNARASTNTLNKAFRSNPYQKFHERYNPNLIDDEYQELSDHLQQRHIKARRITYLAARANRESAATVPPDSPTLMDEFVSPRRKIHSDLEGYLPQELEGIEAILERAQKRIIRQRTISGSMPSREKHKWSISSSPSPKTMQLEPKWPAVINKNENGRAATQQDSVLHEVSESEDPLWPTVANEGENSRGITQQDSVLHEVSESENPLLSDKSSKKDNAESIV